MRHTENISFAYRQQRPPAPCEDDRPMPEPAHRASTFLSYLVFRPSLMRVCRKSQSSIAHARSPSGKCTTTRSRSLRADSSSRLLRKKSPACLFQRAHRREGKMGLMRAMSSDGCRKRVMLPLDSSRRTFPRVIYKDRHLVCACVLMSLAKQRRSLGFRLTQLKDGHIT